MRQIIYLIIIAAAGYLGYTYYTTGKIAGVLAIGSGDVETPAAAPGDAPGAPEKTVRIFKSKIVIPDGPPGEKHVAKPGIYYVLERTSIEHATGVAAVVPGEEVVLLSRLGDGVVKVMSGKYEFKLKESQLTNDLDVAQEAERKFVLTHPPSRQ